MKPTPNIDLILGLADAIKREVALGRIKKSRKQSSSVMRIIARRELQISKLGNKQK